MEKELAGIEPKSASILVAIIVFMATFIFSLITYLYILLVGIYSGSSFALGAITPISVLIMLVTPILYFVLAYIGTYIICFFYNWVAERKGGIKYYSR